MSSVKPFEPTLSDVLVVRAMLAHTALLPELLGTILDYAEYWARSSASSKAFLHDVILADRIGPGEFGYEGMAFLIRSYPVGLTERAYRGGDDDSSQEPELIQAAFPFDGFFYNPRGPEFRAASPVLRPVEKEFDRNFFQKIIKSPSTVSHPVRKIVFRIRSHDQGWTTDEKPGPFIASKSWFDAGIERFDARHPSDDEHMRGLPVHKLGTIEPQVKGAEDSHGDMRYEFSYTPWRGPNEIQRNRMASREFEDYEVTWTCWDVIPPESPEAQQLMEEGKGRMAGDGQFVRNLRLGDVVTVWGRAMHRGWTNNIESVEIDVYWAL